MLTLILNGIYALGLVIMVAAGLMAVATIISWSVSKALDCLNI